MWELGTTSEPWDPFFRNENSAQRGSFWPDIPADIRPKTSVMPSKSWKKTSILERTCCADVHGKTSVWKTSGWFFVPYFWTLFGLFLGLRPEGLGRPLVSPLCCKILCCVSQLCFLGILVALSTGSMLYHLCFTPSTALGSPLREWVRLGGPISPSLKALTLRLLNALNSEDRGLKVRFSLATIAFETFELILCQMLSSQVKNAPSNPYPHYLVRLATSRNLLK